jgi:hypothetical protein
MDARGAVARLSLVGVLANLARLAP